MKNNLTDLDPATRDDVMRYLARGILDDNLPGPAQINTRAMYAGVVVNDLADAHTWIAWLGAGALASVDRPLGDRTFRTTWAEVAWRGWTIRVVLQAVVTR